MKSYPHCSQNRLAESFDSPQFGQSTIVPEEEGDAGVGGFARSTGDGDGDGVNVAGAAAATDEPSIGAPHVSHHSGSPL